MKKIAKFAVIMLLVLLMSPLVVFAKAPKGYLEVKITAKNFKNYFEVVKMKHYDEFGDYDGYDYVLKSKLLKKGYYLVLESNDFAYKYSFTEKYKYKYKKRTRKETGIKAGIRYCIADSLGGWRNGDGYKYDYKYGKTRNIKVLKAKGKLIFIKPNNIIKKNNRLIVKNPLHNAGDEYRSDSSFIEAKTHWDNTKDVEVIDYYYLGLSSHHNVYLNRYRDVYRYVGNNHDWSMIFSDGVDHKKYTILR